MIISLSKKGVHSVLAGNSRTQLDERARILLKIVETQRK